MADLNNFKAEFKNRVIDFATSYQILSDGTTRTQEEKDELTQEFYNKLEKWTLERFNTWIINSSSKTPIEDVDPQDTTISLDF